jgi:hypothetical protein
MPISITPQPNPNHILVIVSGETSMREMMDFLVEHRRGEFRRRAFLIDVSAATVSVSSDQMRMLAAFAADEARKSPMGPVAFISTDPGAFGMSRMFQSYSAAEGRRTVGVFKTLAEAQTWADTLVRAEG